VLITQPVAKHSLYIICTGAGIGFRGDGGSVLVVVLVAIATAALIGLLMLTFARAAFELRVPRAPALGRLGPSAYRVLRDAPGRLNGRPHAAAPPPPPPSVEDVELAVRERLYGGRPRVR
jgi:hypothetical protein